MRPVQKDGAIFVPYDEILENREKQLTFTKTENIINSWLQTRVQKTETLEAGPSENIGLLALPILTGKPAVVNRIGKRKEAYHEI